MHGENSWIPLYQKSPPVGEYILLSFANFPIPQIGELREDNRFYVGDDSDKPVREFGIIVNAWQPLPKCYEG